MTTHQPRESERQDPHAGIGHPVTPTPADTGYDSPPQTATAEEARSETAGDYPSSKAAADGKAASVGLLSNPAYLRNEWQQVQGTFVDNPQRAVQEASALVDRTLREIQENVSRGHISDSTSTDELRVSFQRYREFFERLLSA